LISVASIGSWANSEQVSPWDPKTQFHGFVPALVGVYLPQTLLAKIKIFAVLPPARDEKNLRFFLLPKRGRLCRISAPVLARAWRIAIPIKVVVRQNLVSSYWQPRRNLLFASINIPFTTEHKKLSE
jgi:hypothetical protein